MIVSVTRRWRVTAAAGAAALAASLLGAYAAPAAPPGPPRTMIVELAAAPTISAAPGRGRIDAQAAERIRRASEAVAAVRGRVVAAARQAGIKLTQRRSYHVLLPGMAVEVPAGQVAALRRLPGVAAVHEVTTFHARTVDSVPLVGAPEVWRRTDPAGRPARGSGVTVAVIDTGVDYTHPALGGGFGPGHKVRAGYDFVNDDADPMDDNRHGTHVAGIVAGTGTGGDMAVTGVAPEADLTAYKVLGRSGYGNTEDILAGLEAAVDPANPHRADVVNLSLGAPGDGTDPVGLAATRAAAAGVVVVAAAGNDGPGERTVGSPAAADGVLAVGASASGLRLPVVDLASPVRERVETYRSQISANPPASPVTADVVDVGEGTAEDWSRVGDVRGKVVLVSGRPYPGLSLGDVPRFAEVERRGALAAIGYGTPGPRKVPGELPATATKTFGASDDLRLNRLVVLGMEGDQYAQVRTLLDDGPVRMTVSGVDVTDQTASFSSRGPDPRWRLKPEIVAPGAEIRSSVPATLWEPGVFRFSGTSMAAPHVAGAAALLRQLWPQATAARIRAALIGSAAPTPDERAGVVGAGRLDIPAALAAGVTADPPAMSFGLADLTDRRVEVSRRVTLRNHSDREQQLRLGITPSRDGAGTAKVEPGALVLPPGAEREVTVRLAVPAPDSGSADVSGWLTVDAPAGTSDLRVPYLLAVRTPGIHVSPDPSDGQTEAFIHTLQPAAGTPTVRLRSPQGRTTTVQVRQHDTYWWRARLTGDQPGIYTVTATVPTPSGATIVGRATFDVSEDLRGNRWELVGPHNSGGTLAATPADPDRLAVTTPFTAGVWLTTDRARSWRYHRLTPIAGGHAKVLIDPKHADRMWAAVNGEIDPTYAGRVLRSDDGARSWQVLPFPDLRIEAFAVDPTGTALAAVTDDAIWVSRDAGDSWTSTPAPWAYGVGGAVFAGPDLYVTANNGVWRWPGLSGDLRLVRPATSYGTGPEDVAVAGDVVAVALRDDTVWGSSDGGQTWQQLLAASSLYEISGTGDVLVADGHREMHLSRDQGRTWTRVTEPVPDTVTDLAQWPGDESTLLMGVDGTGVYATTDGAAYTRVGVPGQPADALAATDGKLLVGTPTDVYRTALPADPTRLDWGASGGDGRVGHVVRALVVARNNPRTVWKLYMNGFFGMRLMRSDDAGDTWSEIAESDVSPSGLAVHPADPRRLVVAYRDIKGAGLLVSRDAGATWKKINHETRYTAMVGDPRDPDRLWLGDQSGLWRSDDGGATRVKVLDGTVTAIHLDGDRLVVGGPTIRLSTDGGQHFVEAHQVGAGRGTLRVRVSQIVAAGRVLYAGTTGYTEAGLIAGGRGVLRSVDGGRSWSNIGAGLPDPSVRSLVVSSDGGWLFAGTTSGGVYRLRIGG